MQWDILCPEIFCLCLQNEPFLDHFLSLSIPLVSMRNCCHLCWIRWWRGDSLFSLISGQCLCLPQKLFANRNEFWCSLREMLSLNSRRHFGHYMKGKLLACCVRMPKFSCHTSNWIKLFLWIHILDIMQISKIPDIKLVMFYKKFLKFGNVMWGWLECKPGGVSRGVLLERLFFDVSTKYPYD